MKKLMQALVLKIEYVLGFGTVTIFMATIFIAFSCLAEEEKAVHKPQEKGFWESIGDFFLPHLEKRNVIFEKQTQYFLVTVEEDSNGLRHLVFNPCKGSQGILNPEKPDELISNYCRYTTIFLPAISNPPKRVLFIGLGAGIIPRFLRKNFPDTVIEIVEIDGEIPDVAEKYFGFKKDNRTNITIGDGRDFINKAKEKYDIIFIDAYTADSIPFQLTTREFFGKIRAVLAPGGIMTANIANLGKENFLSCELKTVREIFPDLAVFVCSKNSNYILFSRSDAKLDNEKLKEKSATIDEKSGLNFKIGDLIETRMPEEELQDMTKDGQILKDDFAPVETMD